ncbi:Vacuolar protein sorting 15 [Carabus blaptoides fortunei]
MGNTLVGIAPSEIFPVEHNLTLTDQEKIHFEYKVGMFQIFLGSSRILMVARVQSSEGPILVKVFAIHDPTLPLSSYKDRLNEIRGILAATVNCLPTLSTCGGYKYSRSDNATT